MEEVKKNIKTFLEILQIGKSESVVHWDKSNFERAQRWAHYAEEVYKKLRNKPSLMDVLSIYIKETQESNCGTTFTFNDLHHASGKLRLVLLHNPNLSSAQFSHVLDLYQVDFSSPSNKDLEKLFLDTYSISCSKGTFLTLSSIKDKLAAGHLKEGFKSLIRGTEDTTLDTCAKLLWGNIRNLIEKQKESRSSDDSVIKKKLEALVLCSEKGMEVVLRMLILSIKGEIPVNKPSNDEVVLDQIKDNILHWIVDCSKQNGTENYERIWSCPSILLSEVSAINNSFCESYLTFLHSWGDSLLGIGCVKVKQDQTSYGSCYRHICEHFELLMQEREHVSELCKQKLKLWSVDPAGDSLMSETSIKNEKRRANLWKNIYHETCE